MAYVLEKDHQVSDRRAIEEVYAAIRRLAHWHCSSPGDVDDVAQEAALRVWVHGGFRCDRRPASAWFSAIVHNAAVDLYRKAVRENRFVNRSFHLVSDRGELDSDERIRQVAGADHVVGWVERRLLRQRILYALQELKPEHRQALLMVTDGRSYQEVASVQQVPDGTARSRIFYARRRVRQVVGECC